MALQITVLGLGQVGCSFGLALADQKDPIRRVGFDRDAGTARKASTLKAFDALPFNLPDSVEKADVVFVAMPVDEVRHALEVIAPVLKPEAVVIDASPVKVEVMGWYHELMPEQPFVAMTPVLNPAYLADGAAGPEAARADLFKDGLMVITHPAGAAEVALQTAGGLATLLGASPLFADPWETDGILAAVRLLPELLAAALAGSVADQPGWAEARKFASQTFGAVTAPLQELAERKTLGQAALLNRDNVLRVLDNLILELDTLRAAIQNGDQETLTKRIEHARQERREWIELHRTANWAGHQDLHSLPTASEMILGSRKKKAKT